MKDTFFGNRIRGRETKNFKIPFTFVHDYSILKASIYPIMGVDSIQGGEKLVFKKI